MNDSHFIYVACHIKDGFGAGPVKIGITRDPAKRLRQFQTASPHELGFAHIFAAPNRDIAADIERSFHEVQAEHRLRGEWFNMEPDRAILLMCMCIRTLLDVHTSLEGDDLALALDKCGVALALKKLKGNADGAHTNH